MLNFYRFHHDIESYNLPKPLYLEGFGKVKDVVNSYWGQEQAAEVADNVNIVSDGIKKDLLGNDVTSTEAMAVETQTLEE